tara:strand:- start:105 stop:353 length:249 start_codon:yes stop_codon:yes gene_type:complete
MLKALSYPQTLFLINRFKLFKINMLIFYWRLNQAARFCKKKLLRLWISCAYLWANLWFPASLRERHRGPKRASGHTPWLASP